MATAAAFVKNHNSGTSTTLSASVAATLVSDVPTDNLITVAVSMDNLTANTPIVLSISTPVGETATWVKLASHVSDTATAAAGAIGELWGIVTTRVWTSGTTVTVTATATITAKCMTVREFFGVTTTIRGTAGTGTSTGGTPTASTTGTTPISGDVVIGFASVEQNTAITSDSDTLNGVWDAGFKVNTSGGSPATNMANIQQYKIVTAAGHQTYNPTGGSDSGCGVVALIPKQYANSSWGIPL